ncbi:MAG: hypothetical protein AB7S70_03380 [Hyphomicrobium sp.]|uniref:hypothetical protein n=1 Tax=Hyphomicrobium sp. TaxID=82 RepID=UPI003D11EBF2
MSRAPISAAVLVSAGRHPVSGMARACRGDAVAMGMGRRLAGDRLRVIYAGDVSEPALKDYLALGAGRVEVVRARAGGDVLAPLARVLHNVDIVLTGARAEDGAGSGLLPYALGQSLGRPVVGNVLEAHIEANEIILRQFLPKGRRRGIAAPLPAVLAVHPLAPVELRYAYARLSTGKIEERPADGDMAATPAHVSWCVETARRQPVRLKAEDKTKSAHARLLSAIATEARAGVVAIEGTCVDKAQVMLSFLREHRLVDF